MTRNDIAAAIEDVRPEIADGLHLPRLAVVTAIPNPPTGGERSTHPAPRYAVDLRLLDERLHTDTAMPELRGVPVCLAAAGAARGIAALPQPGTVVEVAFAYGQLHLPFVRAALPYELALPTIGADTMRLQHDAANYIQVDAAGWQRTSDTAIADTAPAVSVNADTAARTATASISDVAPVLWFGSAATNLLQLIVDHLTIIEGQLNLLATHTHSFSGTGPPQETGLISAAATAVGALKTTLQAITKPSP